MLQYFKLLGRDTIARLLQGDLAVNKWYNQLYAIVALLAVAILGISFAGDVLDHNWVSLAIIPIWALIVLYIRTYPRALATVLTASAAASKTGVIASVEQGFEKWYNFTLHAAIFGGVFGLTRFVVPIKAYPAMGLLLLGALITLGLWAWHYGAGTWYKRYVLAIVFASIGMGVYGSFVGKPSGPAQTFAIEVSNLHGQRVCGIHPGEHTFSVPKIVYVTIGGQNTEVSGYILMNNRPAGEKFSVGSDGCADMSFAFTSKWKKQPIEEQIIFAKIG